MSVVRCKYRILCVLFLINEMEFHFKDEHLFFAVNSFQKNPRIFKVCPRYKTCLMVVRCLSFFVHKKRKWFVALLSFALSLSLSLGPVFVTPGLLLAELLFVTELLFLLFRFTAHTCIRDCLPCPTTSSGRALGGFLHRRATLFVGGGSGTFDQRTEEEKTQLVK